MKCESHMCQDQLNPSMWWAGLTLCRCRNLPHCRNCGNCRPLTAHNLQFTIVGSQFTVYILQFTIYNSQLTAHNVQFTFFNSQLLVTHVSHNPWLMADCDCPLSDPSGSSIMLLIHCPLRPSPGTSSQTPLANPGGPTCHPGPWDPGWQLAMQLILIAFHLR